MWIIPAVDLKDGKVVRLTQGKASQSTVYSDDPRTMAERWMNDGAKRLHLVDLDGAFAGEIKNLRTIESVVNLGLKRGVEIQVGGGVRTTERVEALLNLGVSQVILGTAVLERPEWLNELVDDFGKRLIVSMDVAGPFVSVAGWTQETRRIAVDVLDELKESGLKDTFALICTDTKRDGTLEGANVDLYEEIMALCPVPVIAAGGVADLDDLKQLQKRLPEIGGVITGKAIYEGTLNFKDAVAWSQTI